MRKMVLLMLTLVGVGVVSDGENLLPGTDIKSESGWRVWNDGKLTKDGLKTTIADGRYKVEIPAGKAAMPAQIQLIHDLLLESGKKYSVTLKIDSATAGKAYLFYLLNVSPYSDYARGVIMLTPGEQIYKVELKPSARASGVTNASLRLMFGGLNGKIIVSSAEVVPAD